MFGLYSDLPAPKNSGGAGEASTANRSANNNNNNTTSITASPKASSTTSTATSPAAPQQPSSSAEAKSSPVVGWLGAGKDVSPSINALAQSVLLKKKRMQSMQSQTSRAHSVATITAPSRNHSSAPTTPSSSSIAAPFPTSSITAAPTAPASTASSLPLIPQDIEDPYDPIRPNDYEECLKERQRRQFRQQQQQHYDEEEDESRFGDSTYKETDRGGWSPPPSFEAAVPPPFAPPEADAPPPQPQLNISGEEAYLRRARLSGQQAPAAAAPAVFAYSYGDEPATSTSAPAPAPATGGAEAGTVAERMMKKMGWNEGQGLGKRGDGIKKPLLHKKMNTGHSLIIAAEPPPKRSRTKDARTRVVLLRNMVGPGDVDEELAPETAEECTKFGKVRRCEIHEEKDPSVPPQKAVRIFVQFEDCDSAERARNNLNGRFFAKRVVEATYFDEERFEAGDLAAWPNEDCC